MSYRTTGRKQRIDPMEASITAFAARHLDVATLQEQGVDRLDFHDVSVAAIRAALEAAYAAGALAAHQEMRA